MLQTIRLPSILSVQSSRVNSVDQTAAEGTANQKPSDWAGRAMGGSQTFDFSSTAGSVEARSKRSSLKCLPSLDAANSEAFNSSFGAARRQSSKMARLPGLVGLAGSGTQPEPGTSLAPEISSLAPSSRLEVKAGRSRGVLEAEKDAAEPEPAAEMMRIASRFQGELPRLADATKKKQSWRRERLRGLVSTGQSISGIPETIEWILPAVFSSDPSARKAGIFNSPAEIGERLKRRNGRAGRSRRSAASIPVETCKHLPALS